MRTVKRISHQLNRAKFSALQEVAEVFAKEKQAQLEYFQKGSTFACYTSPRQRRDELKSDPEKPDMPAHLRDCAIKDAFETELKYWAALAAEIRSGIGGRSWTEEQKHYAYWLLKVPYYLCAVITGRAPINEKIQLTLEQRKQVQNYLRRSVRRIKGDRPRVKIVRSFLLDPSLYSVVDALSHDVGGQGISIVSLQSGKRIRVPLKGEGEIGGNIRIVLVPQTEQIEVHTTFELEHVQSPEGGPIALDVGVTEVLTDEDGNEYGQELNETLKDASVQLLDKGRKRNKLHALEKRYKAQGKHKKAAKIRKYNLGEKRAYGRNRKLKATISRIINTAINEVIEKRKPTKLITEKLNIRGKAKSKSISRRVSLWHRSILKDRMEFKALSAGCTQQYVNPAYTSQMCPKCGFLDSKNRNGDAFKCLNCEHPGRADQMAAINLKARPDDPEITLYTPYKEVKAILLKRFRAHLENGNASQEKVRTITVSARTLERTTTRPIRQSKNETKSNTGRNKMPLFE
jgi:transposase, IS605 OrfB family, central region